MLSKTMEIFLTGGSGYIGSHLVQEFLAHGHGVTVLSRDPNVGWKSHGVRLVVGDLKSARQLEPSMSGHDVVIHNAIMWGEPGAELQDIEASASLFQASAGAGIKHFVYTSSTAVHRPFLPVMDEQSRLAPSDLYGAVKASTEMILRAKSFECETRLTVVRPGPTVGRPSLVNGRVNIDRRFHSIVEAAARDEPIKVSRDDGRQFIAAGDLARLYASIVNTKQNRETYLCTSKAPTSWEQIAKAVADATNSKSEIIVGEAVEAGVFDVSKIEREFGYVFEAWHAIEETISLLTGRSV